MAKRLITRPFSGASARWTSNYGSGNQFTTKAFYRYDTSQDVSEASLLLDAKTAFQNYLAGRGDPTSTDPSSDDTVVGNYIRSKTHLTGYYGQVLLQSISSRVIMAGLIEMTAVFVGEEAFDSSVSADTIMIYTAGGVTNNFGIPDSRLINQLPDESPDNIDLDAHIGGDALTRQPFTRAIIQYTPLVIDQNGPYAMGWNTLVGKTNSNNFIVPFGPDGEDRFWLPNRVRLDGFSTSPRPLLEADGGVAWATRYQFSICSTAWVNQAIETFENNEDTLRGKIIYEPQYESAPFRNLYS